MKNRTFGLDIGASSIKVVWLEQQKNGFLLRAAVNAPSPSKGMLSESPLDQEEMAQTIRKVIDEAKISTQFINLALPESQVYTRVIEMPVLSEKELTSAIYWEAEQYIPVPLATLTLDWSVLSRPKNNLSSETMQILLVGAPAQLINKYEKTLAMAGLTITTVETEILSAVRALNYLPGNSKAVNTLTMLIIHIGAVSTALAIVKEGVIVFAYSIPTGGQAINRSIASDFGFTLSQAEEYKKVYGVSQKSLNGKIGKATTPILQSIAAEVKKAISFFNEKYKESNPIQQIVLSGGTAKLPDIELFFAQSCGIETVIANPWKVLADQTIPKEILENAPDYTIAVGLAMREYE